MKREESFDAWKRDRAAAEAPAGFTDRVMAAVGDVEAARRRRGVEALLAAILASRSGRIAVLSLSGAALAVRVAGTLGILIAS